MGTFVRHIQGQALSIKEIFDRPSRKMLDKGLQLPRRCAYVISEKAKQTTQILYRLKAPNATIEQDGYPLPLKKETLRILSKATQALKVDVLAAFHKLRIRKGDEEKTAFRAGFGSFEWLVTPFGPLVAPVVF